MQSCSAYKSTSCKRLQVPDLETLQGQACKITFPIKTAKRIESLQSLDLVTDRDNFKGETLEAARRTVGFRTQGDRSSV